MAEGKRVLVTTYSPTFEMERGRESRVDGYLGVLRGETDPIVGEDFLLSELSGEFPKGTEFSEHSDIFATTTFLDMLEIGRGTYDSVVLVNHFAPYATGLGSTLSPTGMADDASELIGRSIKNGLWKLRAAEVPVYVAEWIGYNSYSPLGKIAFPGDETGKTAAEVYGKMLGDVGFSVEMVKRFDFEDGRLERNDRSGEYILMKAVPA